MRMKGVKRLVGFFLLLLLLCPAVAVSAQGKAKFTAKPKVIGIVEPRSGVYADIGEYGIKGVQLALDEYNAAGGVLGSELKMIAEDTQSKPNIGSQKARKLIMQNKAVMIVGEVSSSVAAAMGAVAKELNTVYMAAGANSNNVTSTDAQRVMFVTDLTNYQSNRAMAGWLVKNRGLRWYFLTADYTWGQTAYQVASSVLKAAGGTELGNDMVPLGTNDFSSYLLKVKQAKPDVVYCSIGGSDVVNFTKQFIGFGMRGTMEVSGAIMNDADTWTMGPGVPVGVWPKIWYYGVDNPSSKQFTERFVKKFGLPPENESMQDYVSTVAYLEAVKRAGSWDTAKVVKALEDFEFDGLKGRKLHFRAWDHSLVQQVYVVQALDKWTDKWNWGKVVAEIPGPNEDLESISCTKDENPVRLNETQKLAGE